MERLLELRSFCDNAQREDFPEVVRARLTDEEWIIVDKIKSILQPFAIQTTVLQSEQLSLSDIYGVWAKLIMELKFFPGDQLTKQLLIQMKERQSDLLSNQVLNACLYLDPRYQKYMNERAKQRAIDYLTTVFGRIQRIEGMNEELERRQVAQVNADLEMVLSMMMNRSFDAENDISNNVAARPAIVDILKGFDRTEMDMNSNIFNYWEQRKTANPELYKLASVVHSVSPSQTSVERGFSAFALVLTHLRSVLGDDILENMLIVRLNGELF